ncbi:hypothetical protein ZWY2020_047858 [Hordeum vulgare]|nr:hypothetical protein ZWY2020_047858 [Hordeum vulgare]
MGLHGHKGREKGDLKNPGYQVAQGRPGPAQFFPRRGGGPTRPTRPPGSPRSPCRVPAALPLLSSPLSITALCPPHDSSPPPHRTDGSRQASSSPATRRGWKCSSAACSVTQVIGELFWPSGVERCPFLRNINGATTFSFSSALPVAARGGKGPIFEDGPGFESAFKLFHGQDGIVPLSGRSYVPDENRSESTDVKPEPALPFNPLAARAATISLSSFGPFGFNFFNGKGKKQNKKPNNLDQSQEAQQAKSEFHETKRRQPTVPRGNER